MKEDAEVLCGIVASVMLGLDEGATAGRDKQALDKNTAICAHIVCGGSEPRMRTLGRIQVI